jgi:hypothetical protein
MMQTKMANISENLRINSAEFSSIQLNTVLLSSAQPSSTQLNSAQFSSTFSLQYNWLSGNDR